MGCEGNSNSCEKMCIDNNKTRWRRLFFVCERHSGYVDRLVKQAMIMLSVSSPTRISNERCLKVMTQFHFIFFISPTFCPSSSTPIQWLLQIFCLNQSFCLLLIRYHMSLCLKYRHSWPDCVLSTREKENCVHFDSPSGSPLCQGNRRTAVAM